jgi:hypothetical protein
MLKNTVVEISKQHTKTDIPLRQYFNKKHSKISINNNSKEFLNELLENKDGIVTISKLKKHKKFLLNLNLSFGELKKSIEDMEKAEEVEKKLIKEYPQLNGYITQIQIKYSRNKNNYIIPIHKITLEFNGETKTFNLSYLLNKKAKNKYKNLSIKDFMKVKREFIKTRSEEEYLNKYILSFVPNSEKERIESYKVTGEETKKIEIKLKDVKDILEMKIHTLRDRKSKNKKYNSIEDLCKLKNNKTLTEKDIKEKLGDKVKYFHSFERVRNEEKRINNYFVIFNVNGNITPKVALTTVKNYLNLNDKEFEEKIKNGKKYKTKTDKEVEDDLKSNPKYIETINRYNNSHSTKLRIETTKLIERTKSTGTQKFSIRDSFDKEWEFSRSGLDFTNHTIRFSSSQNFSSADNRNVSKGEAIVEETINRLSRNIPFGARSQDNSLLENHIFDYVFNVAGNPYAILEIDGAQHYDEESETFTRTSLEEQRGKDKEKNVFANQNNLKMARIRYDKLERKIEKLLFEASIYITFLNFSNIQHEGLNEKNQKRFQKEVKLHLNNSLQDILTELELEDKDENIKQLYYDLEWMLEYHNGSENIPEDIFNELSILNLIKEKFNIEYF